jgi:hypothetical protein
VTKIGRVHDRKEEESTGEGGHQRRWDHWKYEVIRTDIRCPSFTWLIKPAVLHMAYKTSGPSHAASQWEQAWYAWNDHEECDQRRDAEN